MKATNRKSAKSSAKILEKYFQDENTILFCVSLVFYFSRMFSALYNLINDCDESMNYWEPMHYILYGFGLQTWEYSPLYALRSYFYIGQYALISKLFSFFLVDKCKVELFYCIRVVLGSFHAAVDTLLFISIKKVFGTLNAFLFFVFSVWSPGNFIASTGFLPSSYAMVWLGFSLAMWLQNREFFAIFGIVVAAFIGWPFAALVGVPFVLSMMLSSPLWKLFKHGLISCLICIIPSILVDWYYYGKPVIAVWNILFYNVLNPTSGGSQLYGVEPWNYYFVNLFLNFNIIFFLALCSLPFLLLAFWEEWQTFRALNPQNVVLTHHITSMPKFRFLVIALSFFVWLLFMSGVAHKEERFMFVVYPHICITAALTLSTSSTLVVSLLQNIRFIRIPKTFLTKVGIIFVVSLFLFLSSSRIFALIHYYNAPLRLWNDVYHLPELNNSTRPIYVCVGKEWYRFPSHYFLPPNARVGFVQSSFRGQLPQYYAEVNGTSVILPHFNDQNKEEPSRYIPLDHCDYFVDFEFDEQQEVKLSSIHSQWRIVTQYPFLNAPYSSNRWFRAFWVPFFSKQSNRWGNYVLLKKVHKSLQNK